MAAVTTVVEGNVKFREGKKWKSRWCVIKKPSPVADQLQIVLYKNVSESVKRDGKCKSVFTIDSYFGLDASVSYDRECNVLAIVCEKNVFLFAFDQREEMIQFEIRIRQSLGEEHRFLVKIVKAPSSSKIPKDQLSLIIHDTRFCLTALSPPKIILSWNIIDLRRYGLRDGKFCFEGGTSCGKGAGLFALQSDQIETIADIIHYAATGKMSNCHRKFKNRSSQIDLGSHLIADIPSLPSQSSSSHLHHIHHSVAKGPLQGALPATLNCCHDNQTGSAESEDWNWYKRHSVSVMDYRRIAALREKSASESRDQLAIGVYDIPPNHDRKLDGKHGYDHPRSFCPAYDASASNTILSSVSDKHEYCNTRGHRFGVLDEHDKYFNDSKDLILREESKESNSFQSDNDEEPRSAPMSRNETLQKLRKQEYNIQKEMKLLDEMLQNCTAQNEETPNTTSMRALQRIPKDFHYANYDEVPMTLQEPAKPVMEGIRISQHEAKSATKDFEIISGNISLRNSNQVHLPNHTTQKKSLKSTVHLNKSMPDETPLSPLFHAKLNSIPSGSKLNAPLPYVNLSRYDDESTSHVHLPGSADCLPVARGSSFCSLNTSKDNHSKGPIVWRQHSGSLSSLHTTPAAASSLTNLDQYSEFSRVRQQSSHARFQLKQAIEGQSYDQASDGHPEILVVNLRGKQNSKEKHKCSLSKLSPDNGGKVIKRESDIVNLLMADVDYLEQAENHMKSEGIYENLPIAREDTPPPALPPKGPALLKKLKMANAKTNMMELRGRHTTPSPSTSHRQNRSFSMAQDSSFSFDSHHLPSEYAQNVDGDFCTSESGQGDDNYLHMGSPKTSHKFSATVPLVLPSKKKVISKDDYMDMGMLAAETNNISNNMAHEDEIYLDLEETLKSSATHPPERRMSGKSVPLGLPPVASGSGRESTYVEMATVSSTRKSMVIQNLETLQAYVSKKPGGEKGASSVQTPAAKSQPPLPRPYKVRHNSDSGLSIKDSKDTDTNSEKSRTKSPMKIYTKVKSTDTVNKSASEPPLPFQNLMEFTKKMGDSSRTPYVNTYIDAEKNQASLDNDLRNIPLPEPVKEGFLARFKRRSSRDKGSSLPEKTNGAKNRISVLERSMSEHDSPKSSKEAKNSKLKIGRRRSSSFPNRLSYQEAHDDDSGAPTVKKIDSSCSSFSSNSVKSKASFNPAEQSESSSSFQDVSDDSDISPLLKRSSRKLKPTSATVLHVQQNQPIDKNLYMHTSRSTSCLISQMPSSSKTDDEKLNEILLKGPSHIQCPKNSFDDPLDLSMEMKHKCSIAFEEKGKLTHLLYRQESKSIGENASEYCFMDPPKPDMTAPLSVTVNLDGNSVAPALPPKNRQYQNILSPVLEATPPSLPPRPPTCDGIPSTEDISGETGLDQYVELDKSAGIKTVSDSKAGRPSNSSTGEETLSSDRKYATITLPVAHTLEYQPDRESCPSHSCNLEENSFCTSPAKSVLRPRTGKEYVVIRRDGSTASIRTSGVQSPGAVSLSSTQGRVFNYDLDPGKSHQENAARKPMSCHHGHQSSCDCTPKSQHSPLARPNSQRSPNLPSDSETIRSRVSPCHDQKDPQKSIHDHSSRARLTSLSVSTLSSLSPSPKTGISLCQATATPNSADLSAKLMAHGDSVFFPDEISISTLSDSAQCDDNPFSNQDYHIYVNQEYVFKHQHQNYGSRRANSGSYATASPRIIDTHSHRSSIRDSFAHGTRQRSRHSESDAARSKQSSHSFGPGDRLQKSLTLPSGVHRSHSDPKRGLSSNSYSFHSQNHIHSKKYDKFAQSTIIARRRQQHARANTEPLCEEQPDGLPVSLNVFTSSPGLQVPSIKTSGYKNIDTMKAVRALANDNPSQNSTLGDISPSLIAPESQFSAGYSDASHLSCNSLTVMTSTPTPASPTMSITPPPIPPRRVSISSTISPPLTPRTGCSDSPPPYRAPSPPSLTREAALPKVKDDSFSNSSSEEEQGKEEHENQGLIYIEVDMTKRQDDGPKIPSVSLSRRNRRARQQKDLAKLRYAEIDHTATKALKQTSEKFRDDRRLIRGSSLSHKSSTSSKSRKSSYRTSNERHLSTTSIESC